MTAIDYAARVAKGVALLDEQMPGWEQRISLDVLDISSGQWCVAGQLSGVHSYYVGLKQLGLDSGHRGMEHGFMAESEYCACCREAVDLPEDYDRDAAYATLTELWREVIVSRRTAMTGALALTA